MGRIFFRKKGLVGNVHNYTYVRITSSLENFSAVSVYLFLEKVVSNT